MARPRRTHWRALAIASGLIAPAVLLYGTFVTANAYVGRAEEGFFFRDHFISELGELGISPLAPAFNLTLIVSGLLVSVFMIAVGLHLHNGWGYAGLAFGLWSGISCVLVGVIPMNDLVTHVVVSLSFFYSGMAAIALLTEAIWLDRRRCLPKWLIVPGACTVAAFFALAIAPVALGLTTIESLDPRCVPRAQLGIIPLIEWVVFGMIIVWIWSLAIALSQSCSTWGK